MPETSLIRYKEKGFWIPEPFMEVVSHYICEGFEGVGINAFSANLKSIYECCDANRGGSYIGMVGLPLDENMISKEDKYNFINVLEQAEIIIASKGVIISIDELNDLEANNKIDDYFKREWFYPIHTQSVINTIGIIKQMLNGTWQSSNYGVYFTGFPNAGNMPEI